MPRTWFGRPVAVLALSLLGAAGLRADQTLAPSPLSMQAARPLPAQMPAGPVAPSPYNAAAVGQPMTISPVPAPAGRPATPAVISSVPSQSWPAGTVTIEEQGRRPVRDFFRRMWYGPSSSPMIVPQGTYSMPAGRITPVPAAPTGSIQASPLSPTGYVPRGR
jgi:hypothetical protein